MAETTFGEPSAVHSTFLGTRQLSLVRGIAMEESEIGFVGGPELKPSSDCLEAIERFACSISQTVTIDDGLKFGINSLSQCEDIIGRPIA